MNKFVQIQELAPNVISHQIYMEAITILPNMLWIRTNSVCCVVM